MSSSFFLVLTICYSQTLDPQSAILRSFFLHNLICMVNLSFCFNNNSFVYCKSHHHLGNRPLFLFLSFFSSLKNSLQFLLWEQSIFLPKFVLQLVREEEIRDPEMKACWAAVGPKFGRSLSFLKRFDRVLRLKIFSLRKVYCLSRK